MDNHSDSTSSTISARGVCSDLKSVAIAPVDRPTFTFIDHDDDLTTKRIKDVNARKAIRSHVMRDVRRRERLAGLKRVSRRDSRAQQPERAVISTYTNKDVVAGVDADADGDSSKAQKSIVMTTPPCCAPSQPQVTELDGAAKGNQRGRRPATFMAGCSPTPSSNPGPWLYPVPWLLDPFNTLPGATEAPSMIARLVFYFKSVFVPMTFPNEQRNCQRAEKELMVKTAFTAPGSFFGLMSICAAHRAVMAGRHSDLMDSSTSCHRVLHDPDYYIMKNNCIRAVNKKLSDPRVVLSDETFDTIINLLTSTLVVGLFGEARIHLTGLKRMVELRGGIADDSIRCSSILAGILVADVKCASGLMVKPVFPLTWDTQPVPSDIQRRIAPLRSSVLNKLGAALFANTLLSFPLLKILNVVRDLILYTQVNNEKPTVLSPEDHHFFRLLNCEAEHQLLSYIYMESEGDHTPPLGPIRNIHPIEAVTRTACICFLNYFMIVSPPSSGLGRALTKHLKNAMSKCALSQLSQLPQENYGVLAWALFIGAQGSAGQIERPWFVERLSRIAIICGWRNWEKVSSILWEYFYVSNTHGPVWKSIWDEAMDGLVVEEIES